LSLENYYVFKAQARAQRAFWEGYIR